MKKFLDYKNLAEIGKQSAERVIQQCNDLIEAGYDLPEIRERKAIAELRLKRIKNLEGDVMLKQKQVEMKLSEASATLLLEAALEKHNNQISDLIFCIEILDDFVNRLKDSDDLKDKVLVEMAQDQIDKFRSK